MNDYFYPGNSIYKFLSKHADGEQSLANVNINGDYSTIPEEFFIKPPAGKLFCCRRAIIHIEDGALFSAGSYGAISELSNGLRLIVDRAGIEILDLMPLPITKNTDWQRYCYDAALSTYGSGDSTLTMRWTFERSGKPIILDGDTPDRLVLKVNDNLSGLVEHTIMIQGCIGE